MVSTRRKANLGSTEPEMNSGSQPTPRPRRAPRAKAAAAAATATATQAAAPARSSRRLRGDASASPLQSLKVEKRAAKRTAAPAVSSPSRPVEARESPSASQSADDEVEQPVFVQIEQTQLNELHRQLAAQANTINDLTADRDRLRDENFTLRQQNVRLRFGDEPLTEGEKLLRRIERRRFESEASVQVNIEVNGVEPEEAMDVDQPATPVQGALSASQTEQPPKPETPQSSGWGLKSLFGRVASVFRPTVTAPTPVVPPATAPPKPLSAAQVQELGESLAIVDTPTRQPAKRFSRQPASASRSSTRRNASNPKTPQRTRSKPKASTTIKKMPDRRAIVSLVTKDISDEEEKTAAMEWAIGQAAMLSKDAATLGDKRKRMEEPWKLKDVEEIPACKPWQTGSFGLLDEFFDDSDEEQDVPEWLKLVELTKEQPPLKKRKTDSPVSVIDTNGNSTSPHDIHPRPSTIPSPMFDNPDSHSNGTNIFGENPPVIEEEPSKRFSHFFENKSFRARELPSSNSFAVPEGSGSSSPEEEEQAWTQPPPPPPAPAHASLPVPLTSAPSIPAMPAAQASMFTAPEPTEITDEDLHDPVKTQRLQALKHTPAKSSRLREMMIPSPSLKSDGGSPRGPLFASPTPQASAVMPAATPAIASTIDDDDMPDVVPLDLGDPELNEIAQRHFESAEYKAANVDAYGGADVILSYDSDSDVTSVDFDSD